MKIKSIIPGCAASFSMLFLCFWTQAQTISEKLESSLFREAKITMDPGSRVAKEIRFDEKTNITPEAFLNEYFRVFDFSKENEARLLNDKTDKLGYKHYRFSQYYKGVELAEVQILVHEKGKSVYLAHGNFIQGLDLDVKPVLTEEDALQWAILHSDSKKDRKNIQVNSSGKLLLSSNAEDLAAESFRLVYRFDITTNIPQSRNYVDVDAKTGELVKKLSLINYDNIPTKGVSLYNDTVSIIVSDENYPVFDFVSYWHLDDWQSYDTSLCWWAADTTINGYRDAWYIVLDTDPIVIEGSGPELSFFHRFRVEPPLGAPTPYNGWDGMNVRISVDKGLHWQILQNPQPSYTCTSLYSFGAQHGEGPGIPGWAGASEWAPVTFDLTSYINDTVMIRFAFASDPGASTIDNPEFFGWQIDNILITSSLGTLYENDGSSSGISTSTMVHEVNLIEGNYRLRETSRGAGITTYNALRQRDFRNAIDYVENVSLFSADSNRFGVSMHWALENIYDYYLNTFGRRSYDDNDARLIGYTNWVYYYDETTYDENNASWNGTFMTCGKGDGIMFNPFCGLDVMGHEIAHGVTQYSAGLIYQNEPGALNESFSDIFGTTIEFYAGEGDWLCGEDICVYLPCLRSLEDPNSTQNPDTYRGLYWQPLAASPSIYNDFGGVHTNCGVQNFWFYLLCMGGEGTNELRDAYSVTGIGISDAEQIAYRNLTAYLQPTSGYDDAVRYSLQSAADLFGPDSTNYFAVMDAWYAVGISFKPKISLPVSMSFSGSQEFPGDKDIVGTSIGLQDLVISDIQVSGEGFEIEELPSLPITLAHDQKYTISVRFTPESYGTTEGALVITSNDAYYPQKTVSLRGTNTVTSLQPDITLNSALNLMISPNPFNSSTEIGYSLIENSFTELNIYSLSGEVIKTLVKEEQSSGKYTVSWDGTNNAGRQIETGVYLCRILTDAGSQIIKMTYLK